MRVVAEVARVGRIGLAIAVIVDGEQRRGPDIGHLQARLERVTERSAALAVCYEHARRTVTRAQRQIQKTRERLGRRNRRNSRRRQRG